MNKKDHSVTVSITSESGGVLNQEVILKEYAGSDAELVYKNHEIADAVIIALNAKMKEMSAYVGEFVPEPESARKGK
jgi:hypothetical protein